MPAQTTLAQLVRAKYPGAYDDLTDAQLEAKIDAAHPGSYADIPRTASASPDPMSALGKAAGIRPDTSSVISRVADEASGVPGLLVGVGKGFASSMADLADYVGAGNAIRSHLPSLDPANEDQRTGQALERFGEVAVPEVAGAVGAGELAARAPAAVAAGQRLAAAHPTAAGVASGLAEGYLRHGTVRGAVAD